MQNYSKRLIEHISQPKFHQERSCLEDWRARGDSTFVEVIDFDGQQVSIFGSINGARELKDLAFFCSELSFASGIVDAYLTLSAGRGRKALEAISDREFESFLRDQNDIPAYQAEEWSELSLSLPQLLLKGICDAVSTATETIEVDSWDSISYVDKISKVESLMSSTFAPALSPEYTLELVAIEENQIILANKDSSSSIPEGVLAYLSGQLKRQLSTDSLNLVAE